HRNTAMGRLSLAWRILTDGSFAQLVQQRLNAGVAAAAPAVAPPAPAPEWAQNLGQVAGGIAPSPPTPLPRFTGARGGIIVFSWGSGVSFAASREALHC
ncbi:MAG: hypothetical protein ACK6EB_39835, partial [Planctomyces sp.]